MLDSGQANFLVSSSHLLLCILLNINDVGKMLPVP